MRTFSWIATLGAALYASACSTTLPTPAEGPAPDHAGAADNGASSKPPAAPPEDVAALARADNRFAADLWTQLRNQPGNLAVSPASISAALAMTFAGARGETAEEMRRTMHFELEPERLHRAYADTLHRWNGDGSRREYTLAVANRLFGQEGFAFLPAFVGTTRDLYAAELAEVKFATASEASRQLINRWVAGKTQDKVRDLLPEGAIDSDTRLVLTNAIYFKGRWASAFDKQATRDAGFTLADGKQAKVPMMQQTGKFGYAELDGVQVLEMPYRGDELSMVVLLPDRADGLPDMERRLDRATMDRWIGAVKKQQLPVRLPRFKISPAKSIALADTLKAMGMRQAFLAGSADLSGMDGKRDLFVRQVFHKAFVEVNEEGTEAAASTAVVVTKETAVIGPSFTADHPFVFVIREPHTGRILFQGRVADPRA